MITKKTTLVLFSFLFLVLIIAHSCHTRSACYSYSGGGNSTGWNYNSSGNGAYKKGKLGSSAYYGGQGQQQLYDLYPSGDSISTFNSYTNTGGLTNRQVSEVATEYERYNPFTENDWIKSTTEPKSTFSIDVDNAAYTNFRRFVNNGQLPPKDAIRMEEWLNFFNYELEAPAQNDPHPLKITTEIGTCPWNENDDLVMIKLQGKLPVEESLPASNLVFLVDVSGSMGAENKLPLVQESMTKLVAKLRPEDKLSIVTYAGYSSVALEPTTGDQKEKMLKAINGLSSGGGTGGSDGIKTAYQLAEKNLITGGNNRVILATDGDWNIGITDNSQLKKLIEEKRTSGIFLSVLGFGMGNLNDQMMEMLADNGNGNYCYVDNEKEADRIFNAEFSGTMFTIAKDVKLQLEFDSTVVESYRLIGYENRLLENWQFEADSIDAGDLGMGQNVIAFYQVKRKSGQNGSLGKIDFRYKPLNSETSQLLTHSMGLRNTETSSDFKFASCVVEFAMCLRESEFRDNARMVNAILRGRENLGDATKQLSYEKRVEFVGLMEKVAEMWGDYIYEDAPKETLDNFPMLKLYPNPATEYTTIEIPAELNPNWSIQIFTMTGTLSHIQHFQETHTGRVELDGLTPGTYLIKVYSGGQSYGYLRLVVG